MDGKIILNALWIGWTLINLGSLLILRNSGKSIRDQSLVIANHINQVTGIIGKCRLIQGCHSASQFWLPAISMRENPQYAFVFTSPSIWAGLGIFPEL